MIWLLLFVANLEIAAENEGSPHVVCWVEEKSLISFILYNTSLLANGIRLNMSFTEGQRISSDGCFHSNDSSKSASQKFFSRFP